MSDPVAATYDFWNATHILHPLVAGVPLLLFIFVVLRISSARSLAPTTIASWLLTVALGSTLSRCISQPDLNLSRALISVLVLLAFEWISTYLTSHSPTFAKLFRAAPVLLVFRGELCWRAMREHRISDRDVYQALRSKSIISLKEVEALILEGNGSFSAVKLLSETDPRDILMHVPDYVLLVQALGEQHAMQAATSGPKEHDLTHRHIIAPARYGCHQLPIDPEALKEKPRSPVV